MTSPSGQPSGMRRSAGIVAVGSALGFLVTLALTPVLSRLFTPATFGIFSSIVAAASVLVGFSTLRLEVLAQRATNDEEAGRLLALAARASVLVGTVATIPSVIGVLLTDASWWWASVGLLVTLASFQLIGLAAYTRHGRYRDLALTNFLQGAGTGVAQSMLGWWRPGVGSLLAGFGLARLVWLRSVRPVGASRSELASTWRKYRASAGVAGSSALVNSLAGQVILLATATLHGAVAAGVVAMAVRVLVAPLSLISQAVAAASLGHVGAALRDEDPDRAGHLTRHGMRDLFLLGALPALGALTLAPWLAPIVLGESWRLVGAVTAALALGAWAQFVGAPFGQLLNVAGRSRQLFVWDVARLVLVLAALVVPVWLGGDVVASVWAYSAVQVALYSGLIVLVLRSLTASGRRER